LLARAGKLIRVARRAAAQSATITPNAGGWLALAEAEYQLCARCRTAESWSDTAESWKRLDRPPVTAYCHWRQAEALVALGASRTETSVPLRDAHVVATRIGANPPLRELELLAERPGLNLTFPQAALSPGTQGLAGILGLTPREAEVLTLVARGYTNREIAEALVISVKAASVHVWHILRKLGTPNRREAALVAHLLAPPTVT
jgi:DNA-binding CsgD family transcriptional regulator